MTIPKGLEDILSMHPNIMHGDLCFKGTRVPLMVLLDNLTEGMSVGEFTHEYPSVKPEQVMAVVAWQQDTTKRAAGLYDAGGVR